MSNRLSTVDRLDHLEHPNGATNTAFCKIIINAIAAISPIKMFALRYLRFAFKSFSIFFLGEVLWEGKGALAVQIWL